MSEQLIQQTATTCARGAADERRHAAALRYCSNCVLPDTRPGLTIGSDGVCSACLAHQDRRVVDWLARREALDGIFQGARDRNRSYDCIIPVSGGKDSTWQVIQCRDAGLRILAVTWRTPGRTSLGQQNLDNLISLGVDHIDYSISPDVEKRFMLCALERTGSSAVPMHLALYTIPLRLAVALDIPLVVWGENPYAEYDGDLAAESSDNRRLTFDWIRRHKIMQGMTAEDWIDESLTRKDLAAYLPPGESELVGRHIESIFLGDYLAWDPAQTHRVAVAHGFRHRDQGPRTGFYNFADIDCEFISVHHYFKWLKFGFTRLFDNLSLEIRQGRMTRGRAIEIISQTGSQRPDSDIRKLYTFLGITEQHFATIEDRFRNHDVWSRDDNGPWMIDGFLISDWNWT